MLEHEVRSPVEPLRDLASQKELGLDVGRAVAERLPFEVDRGICPGQPALAVSGARSCRPMGLGSPSSLAIMPHDPLSVR